MEKKTLKTYLLLISFTIGLVLVVVHFEMVIAGIAFFLRLLKPLFIGIIIAFALNRPYEWFYHLYTKQCGLNKKASRVVSVITVYILAFGAIALLVSMVVPELVQNLYLFTENADQYLLEAQTGLNGFTEKFGFPSVDLSALIDTVSRYLGTLSSTIEEMLPQIVEVTGSLIMGLCDRRDRKWADSGLIRQVLGKQKKPGKPIISSFPGIDTKTALQFGRLFLY